MSSDEAKETSPADAATFQGEQQNKDMVVDSTKEAANDVEDVKDVSEQSKPSTTEANAAEDLKTTDTGANAVDGGTQEEPQASDQAENAKQPASTHPDAVPEVKDSEGILEQTVKEDNAAAKEEELEAPPPAHKEEMSAIDFANESDILNITTRLIAQAPPGQVNDVVDDIRIILATPSHHGQPSAQSEQEAQLLPYITRYLEVYHREQYQAVEMKGEDDKGYKTLLSNASLLSPAGNGSKQPRYVDPQSKRSFSLNHVTLQASDFQPHQIEEKLEEFRADLSKSLSAYLVNHFSTSLSAGAVFCSARPISGAVVSSATPAPASASDSKVESDAAAPGDKEQNEAGLEKQASDETAKAASIPGDVTSDEPAENPGVVEKDDATDVRTEAKKEEDVSGGLEFKSPAAIDQSPQEVVYTVQIVGDKYNTTNFWTGRWRSSYTINRQASHVEGRTNVDVHYFEAGNVQLAASKTGKIPMPPAGPAQASQIITAIAQFEQAYQLELNETYSHLGDKTFKSLRRALPVFRQKIDWEKVGAYKAGWDWIAQNRQDDGGNPDNKASS